MLAQGRTRQGMLHGFAGVGTPAHGFLPIAEDLPVAFVALQPQLARLARAAHPGVVLRGARRLARHRRHHGEVAACQGQVQLVHQPIPGRGFILDQACFHRGLQPFGIGKPAHRQRRRGQPRQPQQRGISDGGGRVRAHDRGRDGHAVAGSGCAVGAAFRLEGRLRLVHDQVHGAQHVGQHVVGLDLQVVRLQLDGNVPVAQVVGGAQQVEARTVLRCIGVSPAPGRRRSQRTRIAELSSATSTSPPRTTVPRARNTPRLAAQLNRWRRNGSSGARPSRVRRWQRA